jgi:predicted nucleic acid-binding protein
MTPRLRYDLLMLKNILIDLNIILDVLLERSGFEASRDIIQLGEADGHTLFISAHIVTTFAYLLENAKVPKNQIAQHIDWLLQTSAVVPVDATLLQAALKSRIDDYEDAVVEAAAVACKASVIITRNIKDFKFSTVQALVPEAFLQDN